MRSPFSQLSSAAMLLPSLFALAILVSSCGCSMMATPQVYRDTSTPIFGELAPELRGDRIPILHVTDRRPASADTQGGRFYGSGRSTSGVLGVADVRVGQGPGAGKETAANQAEGDRSMGSDSPSAVEAVSVFDVIVYEGGGGGLFRHGYYTGPVVGSDRLMLLRYGWRPGEGHRQRLERISPKIWRLTDTARDH